MSSISTAMNVYLKQLRNERKKQYASKQTHTFGKCITKNKTTFKININNNIIVRTKARIITLFRVKMLIDSLYLYIINVYIFRDRFDFIITYFRISSSPFLVTFAQEKEFYA